MQNTVYQEINSWSYGNASISKIAEATQRPDDFFQLILPFVFLHKRRLDNPTQTTKKCF